MVPSSFMISQITPAGTNPANRVRSTEASVCPPRTSTPPLRARKGKTWPGCAKSAGRVPGSMAARIVLARSWAEIPVVTPRPMASIDSVKAVPNCEVVWALRRKRETHQTSTILGHEVDGFGSDLLRRHGQIAFVFVVFVVADDNHATGAKLRERAFHIGKDWVGSHKCNPKHREVQVRYYPAVRNSHILSS